MSSAYSKNVCRNFIALIKVATKQLAKSIVIDAQKIKNKAYLLEKNAKKGLLTKLLQANTKRTNALIEILSETETQKTIKKKSEAILKKASAVNSEQATKSNEDFLKKYYQTPKGGPNHSIAQNRAHHLTKFLRQYILTGFLSGQFIAPEVPQKFLKHELDSNGFLKSKFVFEITNVELPADLSKLKIFWSNSDNEELNLAIEKSLETRLKSEIRSNLTNQRIMNYVPVVEFVRDDTKVVTDELNEFLMKIKIENEANGTQEQPHDGQQTDEDVKEEFNQETNIKSEDLKIDNLYGVDFNRLMLAIKKNSDHIPWDPKSSSSALEPMAKAPQANTDLTTKSKIGFRDNKFELSLKTFQMHERMKHERLSRKAILLLETKKFYQSLE